MKREKDKILFVLNTKIISGGTRSLYEFFLHFDYSQIEPILLIPSGEVVDLFEQLGLKVYSIKGVSQFDNTQFSHYRGFRWLIMLRELFYFPFVIIKLMKIKKEQGAFDIIHFNEITLLPEMFLLRRFFPKVPFVLHIRSVQRENDNWISKKIYHFISKNVHSVLAIDESVKDSLPLTINTEILHNGLKLQSAMSSEEKQIFTIGYIGNFLLSKGILELIDAANICKNENIKFRLLLVGHRGSRPSFRKWFLSMFNINQDVENLVIKKIKEYNLHEYIEIAGFTLNISEYIKKMDVLCFPSVLNACGRPVFEAALHGVPSIVSIKKKQVDTIIDGKTGICIESNHPAKIAQAIQWCYAHQEALKSMGKQAKIMAENNFNVQKNAHRLLEIYQNINQFVTVQVPQKTNSIVFFIFISTFALWMK